MRKISLTFALMLCCNILAQPSIKFGMEGMIDNSIILTDILQEIFGKDSVENWIDTGTHKCIFLCDVDSFGYVKELFRFLPRDSSKQSFSQANIKEIMQHMIDKRVRFSFIYENEFNENEDSLRVLISQELLEYFRKGTWHIVNVGFPGYLTNRIKKRRLKGADMGDQRKRFP